LFKKQASFLKVINGLEKTQQEREREREVLNNDHASRFEVLLTTTAIKKNENLSQLKFPLKVHQSFTIIF
jgi:hypothetical protein